MSSEAIYVYMTVVMSCVSDDLQIAHGRRDSGLIYEKWWSSGPRIYGLRPCSDIFIFCQYSELQARN